MKAVLTVGVPASGKSTKYEDSEYTVINRDDIREELFGFPYKFTKEREKQVKERQLEKIKWCAENNSDIAITDTNLNKGRKEALIRYLIELGYTVTEDVLEADYDKVVKYDLLRKKSAGSDTIWRLSKLWHEQYGIKKVVQDESLEGCYIFDIDGTLAIMHNRGPYDWEKVGNDLTNVPVWRIACMIKQLGYKIIIMSGRDSVCREETVKWLTSIGLGDCDLYMREEGSDEKDFHVKHKFYQAYVQDKYKVLGVFDDRPQVCRLWNLLGLPLFKVGDQQEF